jgi:hypothetical protein
MLRSMNSISLLGIVTFLPALLLSACGDDEQSVDGASGSAGNSTSGGMSASAGELTTAGETSTSGKSSAGGANSSAGNAGAAGDAANGVGGDAGAHGPAVVVLGTANNYAVLAKSEISNVPTSKVTGDLGLSPAAASYVTGFALTKAGTSWTSKQVVGHVFAADNDPPTPTMLTTAVKDMMTAYTDAAGRKLPDFLELGAGAIGGKTLTPGLYKWTSTVTIPTDVTLEGGANDVWIFQVSGDLKLAAAKSMVLSGGADPAHIFWQVAGFADLGTTSHAEGIVLSKTAIKLQTGASINGRLLAQTAVNLAGATVTAPN